MKNPIQELPNVQLAEFKRRIARADEALAHRFWKGVPVDQLVHSRSNFIDGFLTEIWQHWFDQNESAALFAVGGYGRGELHPHSDIDLLLLVEGRLQTDIRLEEFIRLLWDLNLDIGQSVRSVRDCREEARKDVSVMTSLMERRLLAGSNGLSVKLDRALNSRWLWPSKEFFAAKSSEQDARHSQWSDVEYGLEPDVKQSPGGLRDVQTIGWITERHFGTSSVDKLCKLGLLTHQERDTYLEGRSFLWKVRFALHLLAGRSQDHLVFDFQRQIADRFGYFESDGLLAVEKFMRDYYRHVLELREVNDILLQHFKEEILHGGSRKARPLNERFQMRDGYIEVIHDKIFEEQPVALMEIFVVMANHKEITGVRASTIRLIRKSVYLIDEDFRRNPTVGQLFLNLLRSPYTVASHLTRMRRYGILGRYIPAFGRVIGQMQHDLFHIYTVDAHTIMIIRYLRRFFMSRYRNDFPFVVEALAHITKVELLFLAGLFHDIAKGRGGDHSELGEIVAKEFCENLGLSTEDTELVSWLVKHHLALSTTAQKKDIDDSRVLEKFASLVGNERRLSYLVALTVADINATNPDLWNGWRATLISKLYRSTRTIIRAPQEGETDSVNQINDICSKSLQLLESHGVSAQSAESIWTDARNSLTAHQDTLLTVELTEAIHKNQDQRTPFVLVQDIEGPAKSERATQVFVYAENRPMLFAHCVSTLDQMQLQVVNARIETGISQMCYNSFVVLDTHGKPIEDDLERKRISEKLLTVIREPPRLQKRRVRRISRQLTQFVRPANVTLSLPNDEGKSTLELIVSDRPGLLALVGEIFVDLHVELHEARIATLGERVEDIFVVSGSGGQPLNDSLRMQSIVNTMTTRIDEALKSVA
ncbi:MAG: [protein-PII] uridylyltransferase [Gammaproteobacteria bacterium]|nr:[protein-PII] uridylyltransferase [Gammaproteobacteria bacterium]MYD81034.1 [protein-PII] uridylyltransferase [Gammaproteobacteria bacterium]